MLTVRTVEALKARDKPYKVADSGGLHVLVSTTGARLFRLKYRFDGKQKQLSFGQFPDVTLARARELREVARAELRAGRDPGARAAAPAAVAPPLATVAADWHARQKGQWCDQHAFDVWHSLQRLALPALGARPIDAIEPREVLAVLRQIESANGAETAARVRQRLSAVFVFAIASGLCATDPAAIVKGALTPPRKGRQPAVTSLPELVTMLRKAEAEPAFPTTKLALRILSLTVARPGELLGMRWQEVEGLDGPDPQWRIPAERMKMRAEHIVPLSPAAVETLKALHPLTGRSAFVFPNARFHHKPMSENAIGYLLNRAGYHNLHVPHGFRASFSSIMNERYPSDYDAIEAVLAHTVGGVRGRYMRAPFLARRRELLAEWAALLLPDDAPTAAALLDGPRRGRQT